MTHKIKIQKEYADAILSGEKTFEIRINDRGYQKGDHIIFSEVIKDAEYVAYTCLDHPILDKEFVITYLLSGWGLKENWCVFAIKEVPRKGEEE